MNNTPKRIPQRIPRAPSPGWLHALTALCLIAAALLWTWPMNTSARPAESSFAASPDPAWAASATSETTSSATSADAAERMQRVIASNIFSSSRRAPTSRFRVPGQTSVEPSPDIVNATMPEIDPEAEQFPRLSGIVVMDGERRALLQITAADGAPRLYRAGEQHAGVRVIRIDPTQVVLTSRSGPRTLRLSERVPRDSAENSP